MWIVSLSVHRHLSRLVLLCPRTGPPHIWSMNGRGSERTRATADSQWPHAPYRVSMYIIQLSQRLCQYADDCCAHQPFILSFASPLLVLFAFRPNCSGSPPFTRKTSIPKQQHTTAAAESRKQEDGAASRATAHPLLGDEQYPDTPVGPGP